MGEASFLVGLDVADEAAPRVGDGLWFVGFFLDEADDEGDDAGFRHEGEDSRGWLRGGYRIADWEFGNAEWEMKTALLGQSGYKGLFGEGLFYAPIIYAKHYFLTLG